VAWTVRLQFAAASLTAWQPCAAEPVDSSRPAALTVSTAETLSPAVVKAIARVGAPRLIKLTDGQSVRDAIEAKCGFAHPAYTEAFLEENKTEHPTLSADALEVPSPGMSYRFPACVRNGVRATPLGSRTVSHIYSQNGVPLDANSLQQALSGKVQVARRRLGTLKLFAGPARGGSDTGFIATEMARKFQRDNPELTASSLKPSTQVLADTPEAVSTIPVRDGLAVEEARQDLEREKGIKVEEAVVAEIIGDQPLLPEECTVAEGQSWPFAPDDLRLALQELNDTKPPEVTLLPDSHLLLVDTGYDPMMGKPAIDEANLVKIRSFGDGPPSFYSVNTAVPDELDGNPPAALPKRAHGGEVASTLLGGWFLPEDRAFALPPRIAFASIVAMDESGRPFLDIGGIAQAYLIARSNKVSLINASVAASKYEYLFLDKIQGNQDHLIVTAAGNVERGSAQGFTVGNRPWPGSLGGDPVNARGGAVISVGAHDPSGRLLFFSRRGPQVDLLAPGCRIKTYTFEAGAVSKVERSGTSYAAPLVSYVAAHLLRAGLTPMKVKERLILSADVDERVAKDSYSGGRLNVRKALSVWRDSVEYAEAEQTPAAAADAPPAVPIKSAKGRLQTPFKHITVCGEKIRHRDLLKLVRSVDPTKPGQDGYWRGWRDTGGTRSRIEACEAKAGSVSGDDMHFDTGAAEPTIVPVALIRDYTARYDR
jgi:hypothetical protein